MKPVIHAWRGWPAAAELHRCWQQHGHRRTESLYWLIIADEAPRAEMASSDPTIAALQHDLQQAARYGSGLPRQLIIDALPGCTLLWLPEQSSRHDLPPAQWHTAEPPTVSAAAAKPWLALPAPLPPENVLVVGGGIAGAATAHALARRGVAVTLVEQGRMAAAASGNRQGLLYAKIAAHVTTQTELLLAGYAHSRRLLDSSLAGSDAWQACGVLHLNHNPAESRRNRQLATQGRSLYRGVNAAQASALAGIPLHNGGLWWPHGAWIHPPAWVAALLDHPLIACYSHTEVRNAAYTQGHWQVECRRHGRRQYLSASHVVVCAGADSARLPWLRDWPLNSIRGQTAVANAGPLASKLRCALSGASYISPAWQGQVCFGASFVPRSRQTHWCAQEHQDNWQALATLSPQLAADLATAPPLPHPAGHAALRCDSFDHLPVVGPVGDAAAMRNVYARLSHDKHWPVSHPCPWLPGVFANTAHGSRGLATAPLCAEAVAAAILGLPSPLTPALQAALHPNRLPIRSLTHHQPWPAEDAASIERR